jgi:hypothetical protein
MTTAVRCPSELALEAHLLEPERSEVAPHLASCARCQARLAEMEKEGEDFRRFVFPATVEKIEEAAVRGRRTSLRSWLVPFAGLAAAAIAAVVVFRLPGAPEAPDADYVGTKGGLALAVFVRNDTGAAAVADGAQVPAAAWVRFKVQPAKECRLWIASVDGAGQVSRLYPLSGEAARVSGATEVPASVHLDGVAGPERIYAVCAPQPLAWPDLERVLVGAAGGGAEKVRAAHALPGLPSGTTQTTLLLEKRP